jgi:hypothetical protein
VKASDGVFSFEFCVVYLREQFKSEMGDIYMGEKPGALDDGVFGCNYWKDCTSCWVMDVTSALSMRQLLKWPSQSFQEKK